MIGDGHASVVMEPEERQQQQQQVVEETPPQQQQQQPQQQQPTRRSSSERELDQPCSPISEGTERTTSEPSSPQQQGGDSSHYFAPIQQQPARPPQQQQQEKRPALPPKRFSSSYLQGAGSEEDVQDRRGSHGSQLLQLQLRHGGSGSGGLPPLEPVYNPRRGSATGSFGLPVPPDWVRAQAADQQSRRGSKGITTGGGTYKPNVLVCLYIVLLTGCAELRSSWAIF